MFDKTRNLNLCVCDYNNNVICDLYDNKSDVPGQAVGVFVTTERNGWKELTFSIPAFSFGDDEKEEENYRIKYLIADYRIRLIDDEGTDWYLLSEPQITHNGIAKTVDVRAGHISQLLKTKSLDLEFSDQEGNNTGTANALLTTVLEGTGWNVGYVADFYEDDQTTVKVRSLTASTKTGAFRLIEQICDLFDAKPIYHGEGRIVDIVPMNPFSRELAPGEIPEEVTREENPLRVYEMCYDRNVKNITRTVNTDNLCTRLYAYGSYGDENGICSIQTCSHDEYILNVTRSCPAGTELAFKDKDNITYYFTATHALNTSSELVWNTLDITSKSYVWNKNAEYAYRVYKEQKTTGTVSILATTIRTEKNYFPFLLSFKYYDDVGLLSDAMFQKIASYQMEGPEYYKTAQNAAKQMTDNEFILSNTFESNAGFLKLAVSGYDSDNTDSDFTNALVLNINTSAGDHGVLYRSDYDEAKRNYFNWHVASKLNSKGYSITNIGSVVYIIHDTNPVTWDIAYVKKIIGDDGNAYTDDQGNPTSYRYGLDNGEPSKVVLWIARTNVPVWRNTDRFYLFCANAMSGSLGEKMSEDESVVDTLNTATTLVTVKHPTYFVDSNDPLPSITTSGYGWCYKYNKTSNTFGSLYFYKDTQSWKTVVIAEDNSPAVVNDGYYFNTKKKTLWHGENGSWVQMKTSDDKNIAIMFSKVIAACYQRDVLYKGLYEKYIHHTSSSLPVGNYAVKSPNYSYWIFTTDRVISSNQDVTVDLKDSRVYQDSNVEHIVHLKTVQYDVVDYPSENELLNTFYFPGTINNNGVEENSSGYTRTPYISAYEKIIYQYSLPRNSSVLFFNQDRVCINKITLTTTAGTGTFTTPADTSYFRFVCGDTVSSSQYVRVQNYGTTIFIDRNPYKVLNYTSAAGDLVGIIPLMKKFADTADTVYYTNLNALNNAQRAIKDNDADLTESLGDMLREGYWQDNNYVEGDEEKLYKDALDNLKEISEPDVNYSISFLDLYESNKDMGFMVDETKEDLNWPDIKITDAVHLIDQDTDTNCWAYIDKINKCYDRPWETSVEINTKLSLIDQHSFTDVLSRIAEVASETKAKETIYKRSAALTDSGKITADRLEGKIKANNALILGGSSNWYTDIRGNIVFETTDGSGAMMLTGFGLLIANAKETDGSWRWRSALTGGGLSADEVTTGFLSATVIEAGSITTDKLNASVGQELEIGSNKALMLYATTDGFRPAGGVLTPTVREGDSYIEIAAKNGNNPAYINIASGGVINIKAGSTQNIEGTQSISGSSTVSGSQTISGSSTVSGSQTISGSQTVTGSQTIDGTQTISRYAESYVNGNETVNGTVNIESGANVNLKAGSNITLRAKADIEINAAGRLYIASGSDLSIYSPNFNVYKDNNNQWHADISGTIHAWAGDIAGWVIGREFNQDTTLKRGYIYTGTETATSSNAGVYLGTDGINFVSVKNGAVAGRLKFTKDGTAKIDGSTYSFDAANGQININADSDLNITAADVDITGNSTVDISGSIVTMTATSDLNINGADININASNTINISSNQTMTVATNGKIQLGYTGNKFTIGGNQSNAYIYSQEMTSRDAGKITPQGQPERDRVGIYLGSDGIALGGTKFKVTDQGILTATAATISGNISADSGTIGGITINKDYGLYTNGKTTPQTPNTGFLIAKTGDIYVGWDNGRVPFSVTNAGALTATSATISGTVTATSGSIGGITIGDNIGIYTNGKTSSSVAKTGFLIQKDGNIYIGWDGQSCPFTVTDAGALTATSANIKGTITAQEGSIGGFTIKSNYLGSASTQAASQTGLSYIADAQGVSNVAFWAGHDPTQSDMYANSKFAVKNDGTLKATEANITGVITATSGSIGGFMISTYIGSGSTMTGSQTGLTYIANEGNTDNVAFWAGHDTTKSGMYDNSKFAVTNNGKLKATDADIKGKIAADEGTIGGFTIKQSFIGGASEKTSSVTGLAYASSNNNVVFWAGHDPTKTDMYTDSKFAVRNDGKFKATDAEIEGTITAKEGTIGGFTIKSSYIGDAAEKKNTETGLSYASGDNVVFWAGHTEGSTGYFNSSKFAVKNDGTMKAESATIQGTITAKSGTIGGIYIGDNIGIYTNNKTSSSAAQNGFLIDKNGNIYIGWDSNANTCPFIVTSTGSVTATNATIKGAITATSGKIGAWEIDSKLLYAKPNSSSYTGYVALDGSTDKYPLSGYTVRQAEEDPQRKAMYAMWAGAQNPQSADFSVTKDGIVTIRKLRVKTADNTYVNIDFNDWNYNSSNADDVSTSMGKLRFQTVKNITQDANGTVTINTTSGDGTGTKSWTFNTAASVKLGDGVWSSVANKAEAQYKARCYYTYNNRDVQVQEKDTTKITGSVWPDSMVEIIANWNSDPDGHESFTLFRYNLSVTNSGWDNVFKNTYKVQYKINGQGNANDLYTIEVDGSDVATACGGISNITFNSSTGLITAIPNYGMSQSKSLTAHNNCAQGLVRLMDGSNPYYGKIYDANGNALYNYDRYWYACQNNNALTTYYN